MHCSGWVGELLSCVCRSSAAAEVLRKVLKMRSDSFDLYVVGLMGFAATAKSSPKRAGERRQAKKPLDGNEQPQD